MNEMRSSGINIGKFVTGAVLLAFGVLLLIGRAGVLDLDFSRVLGFLVLLFGGYRAVSGFGSETRSRIFLGSVFFLSGFTIVLRSYDYIPSSWEKIWPAALVIPGLAFLMLYFSRPKDFAVLVLGLMFVVAGWLGLFAVSREIPLTDRIPELMRMAGPGAVVIAGFYILWKNFRGAKDEPQR